MVVLSTLGLWLALLAGPLSHYCIFIHGEWHLQAANLLITFTFANSFTVVALWACGLDLHVAIETVASVTAIFLLSLMLSIGIYRKWFHRISGFPGPTLAGVSKFWHVWHCRNSQNHLVLEGLRHYGPFVRVGPSEIVCFVPDIISAIDGPQSRCIKSVWYDMLYPDIAINSIRDRASHRVRRRIWDRGFTKTALVEYQARINENAQRLESVISEAVLEHRSIEASDLFYWYSFDVMGEFAFGSSFNMLQDKHWHYAVLQLRKALRILGLLGPVPWLIHLALNLFPWLWVVRDWIKFMAWCRKQMTERIKIGSPFRDVSSYLIEDYQRSEKTTHSLNLLNGDSVVIVIAGSDTTGASLTHIFYELAQDSDRTRKIREEIQHIDIYDTEALSTCRYLNGAINEAQRLHPSVPSHGYRETPPEGIFVAGTYIPGNITLMAPRYSMGRLETCFEDADQFIPERWFSRPDLVKDARAFNPFGRGPYACVGKALALQQLRLVVALLVSRYNVTLAPGEDGTAFTRDKKDYFTAQAGRLALQFSAIEKGQL